MTATLPSPHPASGMDDSIKRSPSPGPSRLPRPSRTRWQPLRIGLVDLFYYDVEEFWFRDGRLLLRGNNGTGKSKVLALTLPFLLDGDLAAHRVEPDGDPKKRMEWNLLLGGEHPHPERLGYTWIEFGRLTESGAAEFRTLGCGLKAVSGRGIARHWFFVTDQRVGDGLSLLDATRSALSRDRLADAVEGHGMVYDQAKAYRRAVDEALFGLGEQRYGALVDLLVQLRQPQLSKRPNETALSKALTEALPPMDQAVVADVAEAFRSLDEEKDTLRATAEAKEAAAAFLEHYRRYARAAARRKARLPRTEHSRYEHLQRELNQAQEERERAEEAVAAAEEAIAELDEHRTRLQAQDAALRAGPEMRNARELEQAATDASRTAEAAQRAAEDRDRATEAHTRALGRLAAAQNRLASAGERLDAILARGRRAAERARIADGHNGLDAALRGGAAEPELRRAADESTGRRQRTVDHLEQLAHQAEQAAAERLAAGRRLEEAETELTTQTERESQAEQAAAEAGDALVAAVREHLAAAQELRPSDPAGLLDRLQDWTVHLHGPYPARTESAEAHRTAAADLADTAARLTQETSTLRQRRTADAEELAALEAGGQRGPQPAYTRSPEARDGVPGAPLWRLVDFQEDVTDAQRAGLEAALEASGLLDAWVCPDGTALREGTHDVLLSPGRPVAGPSLTRVLRPALDHGDPQAAAIPEETVARLLAAIGLGTGREETPDRGPGTAYGRSTPVDDPSVAGSGHARAMDAPLAPGGGRDGVTDPAGTPTTWVDLDGRFRVGALTGSWSKPAAEYLGEGAREEARRARIAALRADLARTDAALEALRARMDDIAERRRVLDAELAAVPDDSALRQAHALSAAAADATRRTRDKRAEREEEFTRAAHRATGAGAELAATADELGLPAGRAELHAIREALADYRLVLAELWPAVQQRADAADAVGTEQEETERTAERAEELTARAEAAAREAAAAEERHTTLASTVGAAVAELQRRLTETTEALRSCDAGQRRAQREHTDAVRAQGEAVGRIRQLETDVTDAVRTRGEAIASLQRFAATGLLTVALPDLELPAGEEPWAATPAVALARAIESELAGIDDSDAAWERVQRRINDELKSLQDALSRHGHSASGRMAEDGLVVDIVFQGRERAVPELASALAAEVEELQRMLSAHEREILETHLLTEVAGTLQELIGTAERQVQRMNTELAERPTSTGMQLRLVWRPSRKAPAGLTRARERLRQSADAWSPDDRAAVGEFLQTQIAHEQAENTTGTWLEHLTAALDYRAWHEFGIERHQHGQWRSATGPASGGERVLSVSVPLFAAASSHYATAGNPHAPRLVTLDEAFAGVDDDSRAKCLGLLHAFDLDVVMTSEREWACYPQVPGIAIAQLSRIDEVAAVLVTRWEWDGTERVRGLAPGAAVPEPRSPGEEAEPAPRPVAEPEQPDADQETLWT